MARKIIRRHKDGTTTVTELRKRGDDPYKRWANSCRKAPSLTAEEREQLLRGDHDGGRHGCLAGPRW